MVKEIGGWMIIMVMGIKGISSPIQIVDTQIRKTQVLIQEDIDKTLEQLIEERLSSSQDMGWMTSQNRVLEVEYNEGHVTINLHPDMVEYGGGTYTEYLIGSLIMEVVFENSDAEDVTILVDTKNDQFPEGSDYTLLTRDHYLAYYQLSNEQN